MYFFSIAATLDTLFVSIHNNLLFLQPEFPNMRNRLLYIFILLTLSPLGFSQEPAQDSIVPKNPKSAPSLPIDSTFVTFTDIHFDSIFLNTKRVIDTNTFNTPVFDPLEKHHTIYSTLSNVGLAHKSMRFDNIRETGFDMSLPSFNAYIKNERNMVSYQSVLPYSELRYVMTSGDKEQHLDFRFGRQIWKRLFLSFGFRPEISPGVFKNNRSFNTSFWVNVHYITESQRYAAMVYAYRNRLEMQENGGIVKDESYTSHTESDNSVLSTNLSNAVNYVKSSGVGLEHYFNLLPQKVQVKAEKPRPRPTIDSLSVDSLLTIQDTTAIDSLSVDSLLTVQDTTAIDSLSVDSLLRLQDSTAIDTLPVRYTTKKRKFTLGRICHEFNYQLNQLYYNETSPSVAFFRPYDTLLNTSKTTDSTIVQAIRNTLKWNNLGYRRYEDDIPFYFYAGLTHGFYKVKLYDYVEGETVLARNYQQLSVNGGIIVNLFKSTRITGQADLVALGYQIGDFNIRGQWKQFIGTSSKNFGFATFDAQFKRQSANWFEESYYSNHFRWDNDFRASTYLTFDLKYTYKEYSIGVKNTTVSQYIYFGTDAYPTQFDGTFNIWEAYLSFHHAIKRFEFEGFARLQKANNEDVIHLPLVMARLRFSYSIPIFRKAATLQPILSVSYFTKYFADAYMPATRIFYLQNDVEIGNYPFIDLALAIKVKKANIFVSYSNMMLLTGNYNSFIAPHYPMRSSKFFFGVNWRLFN